MKVSFEFRDFIAYSVPGLILLFSLSLLLPPVTKLTLISMTGSLDPTTTLVLLIFVASYPVGQASMVLALRIWGSLLSRRGVLGDPRTCLLIPRPTDESQRRCLLRFLGVSFSNEFIRRLLALMVEVFGKSVVEEEKHSKGLFYLCWRLVELKCQDSVGYLHRTITLSNFLVNMIIPILVFGAIVFFKFGYNPLLLALLVFCATLLFVRFARCFSDFVCNVYRMFFVWCVSCRKESGASGGSTTVEDSADLDT